MYIVCNEFRLLDEVMFDQVPMLYTHCSAILYRKPMTLLI